MRAVIQRVTRAQVTVDGTLVGQIESGMLVLLGVLRGDTEREAQRLAQKIAHFRFFVDEEGRMNESALDQGREVLVVSQFTLAADGRRGRRPSFDRAADPERAEPLYELFIEHLRALNLRCSTGRFGAKMEVELSNQGPVTFVLDEDPPARD